MDSMRSLNTSLPASSTYQQPPEQLLQSFKAAALSVTNLYKSAVSDQGQARQAGYQDAIEDLLSFLDRENLGLGDGEGWKVRQWATERLDGPNTAAGESDDERGDLDKRARSSSPVVVRKEHQQEPDPQRQPPRTTSSQRGEAGTEHQQPQGQPQQQNSSSAPLQSQNQSSSEPGLFPRPTVFTFTAAPQFPPPLQDVEMPPADVPVAISTLPSGGSSISATSALNPASVSVSVVPRSSRAPHRQNNTSRHSPRSSTRDPSSLGSKRKLQFPDFFDLSGLSGRELFGGNKRPRFG
ncbi:hypothetical protein Egran_04492 [Elaphomyces granulatus]|uniref:Uncharacterized protein n=1 Tax=Elaphomyces granulatus TaxID=519963 RepID=A0A232LUA8_9EURO|nr:hypothetical protein Egran_04492 [Elaphomyces granulatus]